MWHLLICQICTNLFEKPKILPCVHSFCTKCLEGVLSKQKSNVLKCPTCRVVVRLHARGIADIPCNFFLDSVLDIMKRETSACCSEDSACDACSVTGLRNLRCEDCDMLLCTKCLHAHHDSVLTPGNKHAQTTTKNENTSDEHASGYEHARAEIENERDALKHENKHAETLMKNESTTDEHGEKGTGNARENESDTTEHENEIERARIKTNDVNLTPRYEVSTRNEIGEHALGTARNATPFTREHQVHMALKCKLHPREDLRFFCSSCAQLVCEDCVIAKHITHIFVCVSDATPSSKAQLNTLLNQTTIRVLYLSDALRDVKDTEEQLRSCVAEITNTLHGPSHENLGKSHENSEQSAKDEQTSEITSLEQETSAVLKNGDVLENQTLLKPQSNFCVSEEENQSDRIVANKLLNHLKTVARKKFEVLARHRSKLETRLGLIENCQTFTMNLILNGSDEEILILENCIMESLGELCQRTPEVPIECPDDSFVALSWREGQRLGGDEETGDGGSKGEVIYGEGCGSCCFATGEGLTNAVVGQECIFTVTVKNEQNNACLEGRGSIVARIKTPNGGYFKAELAEHKLGKHKFRYRTYVAGPHVLRITLRGEEILGSPFEALSSGSTDYSRRGRLVTKFGRLGSGDGEFCQPQGLAVDRLSRILVADTGNHRVQVFDESGQFLFAFGRGGTGPGEFNEPCDVTIAKTGHVVVADKLNDRLQFFTPDGKFVRQMHCGIVTPTSVTTDQCNNLLVVDSDHSRVLVMTMSGDRLRSNTRASSGNVQDVVCNQTGETFIISRLTPARNAGVTTATKHHASLIQVFDSQGDYIREFTTPSYTRPNPNLCRLVTDYDDRVLATGSGNKVQVFTRVGGHLTNITFTEKDCNQIDISAIALSPNEAVVVSDTVNGRILVF